MKELLRDEGRDAFYFEPGATPALRIEPGETILIQTKDCYCGLVQSADDIDVLGKMGTELQFNPLAGPVYVRGAEPGDNLIVTIDDIQVGGPARRAVFGIDVEAGILDASRYALHSPLGGPTATICRVEAGKLQVPIGNGGEVVFPLAPIVGTIGVAPAHGAVASFWHTQDVCGNIDSPDMTIGTRLTLPVNVPGGLLSIGDVAAVTGDGEILSHADTDGDVTLTVDLVKREACRYVAWPQIETRDAIGSIGCDLGSSLIDAIRTASKDMVMRLHRYYGLDTLAAYTLHCLALKILVNQAYIPTLGASCTAKVDKTLLKQLGAPDTWQS